VVARPGGRALLAFATGTELTVEEGGDLTIVEGGATKVFALGAGVLHADVAKLGAGERLLVRTPDAEVEVRGTSFRVAVAPSDPSCGHGTTTRLSVYEGAVTLRVRGVETRVEAGMHWPAGCGGAQAARATNGQKNRGAVSLGVPRAGGSQESSATPPSLAASTPPSSTLAQQNDLFADAMAAKRGGDAPGAIARFDSFLARYPSSPLAESAASHRMKLLREVDRPRAVDAARAYLARWPNGFARAEAEAIIAERP
jgi:hypothetical protein